MTAPSNLPFDPSEVSSSAGSAPAPSPAPMSPPSVPMSDPGVAKGPVQAIDPLPSAKAEPAIQTMPRAIAPSPVATNAMKEPEDIFSDVDHTKSPTRGSNDVLGAAPSGGSVTKYIIVALVVLVLLTLIGGGFWYFAVRKPTQNVLPTVPVVTEDDRTSVDTDDTSGSTTPVTEPLIPEPDVTAPIETTSTFIETAPVTTTPDGTNIPLPTAVGSVSSSEGDASASASVDADGDGLSDQREIELGLNPQMADSDTDELSDGLEVLTLGTNPLNRDTDGDGFTDGGEVKNGYNPRGPGKCAKQDCSL